MNLSTTARTGLIASAATLVAGILIVVVFWHASARSLEATREAELRVAALGAGELFVSQLEQMSADRYFRWKLLAKKHRSKDHTYA